MTAIPLLVLVLALWLAFPAPGAAGHRLRRALQGTGTLGSADSGQQRSGLRGPRPGLDKGHNQGHNQGHSQGPGLPPAGRSPGSGSVPVAVVVQQLAALLKGGRIPARLWDELWVLYGGNAGRDTAAIQMAGHGAGPGGTGTVSGPALGPASLRILAAARAAAMLGSSVAAAIRREILTESARENTVVAAARRAVSVRAGRDLRVWGELAACFDTAEASGCPLADVLARFAAHLETEDDAEAARRSALAGPRATVRLLTWLPLSGLGLGLLLGVDPVATLLGNPWGLAALAGGVVLTAVGRVWSAQLVRAAAGAQS